MTFEMLVPAAVLVLWTMIVLLWMTARRMPPLRKVMGKVRPEQDNRLYRDIEPFMPAKANWASHNYTHLMEQPTIFYPAVIILHLTASADTINLALAWSYVGLRIAHSIWQFTVNTIPVRITLFVLSSLCLLALAVHAVMATLQIVE